MAPKCSAHLEVTERKTCLCLCWRDAGLQYGTWLRNFQGWFWTYGIFFSWSELEPGIHLSYYLLWLSCNSYRETEGECLMFFIIMCLLFATELKKKKTTVPFLSSVLPLLALWISFSIQQAEQQCWGQRNPFDSKMAVGNLRTQASW